MVICNTDSQICTYLSICINVRVERSDKFEVITRRGLLFDRLKGKKLRSYTLNFPDGNDESKYKVHEISY